MAEVGENVTVFIPVWAEYSIDVEVTAEMVDDDGEIDYDQVLDEAYDNMPSGLCYGCATGNSGGGWAKRSPVNLELGEDAEVRYITDDQGQTVWGDPSKPLGW